ncbi:MULTISPECIES: TetR/AcrR family transcriptional regulator [unclassified Caballeronia]|uniref:TetR/AcrR family transcriptional regulator n=1 Tax=unclassified Caballeronia TaxID=2646786 RepID=UPI0020277E3D|nr:MULTISPECIES: TetR/AcrR family transcriptional regulator [unclassified Caballeronia]
MARPREFDEQALLDATVQCFWSLGYEATSVKVLTETTGLTAASLYNAYGDKRGLFRAALDRYIKENIGSRLQRCAALPPLEAIQRFFEEILSRSLNDRQHKGCMLVNSAMETAPHDGELKQSIAAVLARIESFFLRCIKNGQANGTITQSIEAEALAQNLLGVLMGVRVLARVRPEKALLEGVIAPALAQLIPQKAKPD